MRASDAVQKKIYFNYDMHSWNVRTSGDHCSKCRLQRVISDHRLSPIANKSVGSYQAGFMDNRSILKQFFDFKSSYGSFDHICSAMEDNHGRGQLPGKLLRLTIARIDEKQNCSWVLGEPGG